MCLKITEILAYLRTMKVKGEMFIFFKSYYNIYKIKVTKNLYKSFLSTFRVFLFLYWPILYPLRGNAMGALSRNGLQNY